MNNANNETAGWRALLGSGHRGAVVVLATGVLVGAVNIYLASSLLPTAIGELGGAQLYAWNMTVYLVTTVLATMLTSRALGCYGNVGAALLGFGVFLIGSLGCAASPTMTLLLLGRAVQGFGAGLLSGLGFALIRTALPRELWTKGNALMSAMYGVGNFAGPALGGLFAQFGAWRSAFGVMALLAAGCALVVPRVLPPSARTGERTPLPWRSLLLLTAATAAVCVAGVLRAAPAQAGCLVLAAVLLLAFLRAERRGAPRVLPAAVYLPGSRLKWVYLALGVLACGVAVESFLPLFGQRLAGLSPLAAGFFGAVLSLGWSLCQLGSASLTRTGLVRVLCAIAPLLLTVGFTALGLLIWLDGPVLAWLPALVLAGAGIGIAYPHLSVAAMSAADGREGAAAAAAVATVTSLSIGFGTALGGMLVNLGGTTTVTAGGYLLFGFALLTLLGLPAASAASRAIKSGDDDNVTSGVP